MRAARAVGPSVGLDLITALAVAGVGGYVFVLYTVMLSGDPGRTPFDVGSLEIARDLHTDFGVEVAKVVTVLGSLPGAIALLIAAAVVLAAHRRLILGLVLLGGLALIYAGVHLAKAGVDRPRPAGGLIDTAHSSFPSGHAAYATSWVAAAVGLSRIYLRVHYWSDVAGGWGLGFAVFGALAAGVLVVTHIRQNEAAG